MRSVFTYIIIILIGIILITMLSAYYQSAYKVKESEVKINVREISQAVEEYYITHDSKFPADFSVLMEDDFLKNLPANPFHVKDKETMKNIDFFGVHSEGDFSYIPYLRDNVAIGFYLVGYGSNATIEKYLNNEDVILDPINDMDNNGLYDNCIIILRSSNATVIGLPPLNEYIKDLLGEKVSSQD